MNDVALMKLVAEVKRRPGERGYKNTLVDAERKKIADFVVDRHAQNGKFGDQVLVRVDQVGETYRIILPFGYRYKYRNLFLIARNLQCDFVPDDVLIEL